MEYSKDIIEYCTDPKWNTCVWLRIAQTHTHTLRIAHTHTHTHTCIWLRKALSRLCPLARVFIFNFFLVFIGRPGYGFEQLFLVYVLLLVQVCENDLVPFIIQGLGFIYTQYKCITGRFPRARGATAAKDTLGKKKEKCMTMTFSKGKSSNCGDSHFNTPSAARIMKGSPNRNSEKSVWPSTMTV